MKDSSRIAPSEITGEGLYHGRRHFLARAAALLPAGLVPVAATASDDAISRYEEVTNYNNFYEYSTDKKAVAALAENLQPSPWRVEVKGEVERPKVYDAHAIGREFGAEERIYRLRCVEGWSAVIPWTGVPLAKILKAAGPTSRARYVRFVGPHDPGRFYAQRSRRHPWPYVEGLTIEEAMHPLTLLATGMYGGPIANQCGAPVRLVVPWKYGYKSIKSIVSIELEESRPESFWMRLSPSEYGFHANVDPEVPHPRWSQAREVRLGEMRRRPTLLFNGYGEQVAQLYRGLDLRAMR